MKNAPVRIRMRPFLFAGLALLLYPTTASAEELSRDCRSRLYAAFERPADVSVCDFVRTEDGRLVTVTTRRSVFLRTRSSLAVRLDRRMRTLAMRSDPAGLDTSRRAIAGRQSFPDAKWFYHPFTPGMSSDQARRRQGTLRFSCPRQNGFAVMADVPCDDGR